LVSPLFPRFSSFSFAEEAIVQREQLNVVALEMIRSHSLFGVGLGNFIVQLSRYIALQSNRIPLQPVHNIYLLLAAEAGVGGFMLFIYFIYLSLKRMFKYTRLVYKGTLIIFICVLLLGTIDHYLLTLQQGRLLFSFIIGLVYATSVNHLGLKRE
jgi:O-antigen ligase